MKTVQERLSVSEVEAGAIDVPTLTVEGDGSWLSTFWMYFWSCLTERRAILFSYAGIPIERRRYKLRLTFDLPPHRFSRRQWTSV